MEKLRFFGQVLTVFMQRISLILFAALAVILLVSTGLAAAGIWPWVDLAVQWNGQSITNAGLYAQVGLTVFALTLCFFLPSNWRILQLETSHRRFDISLDDVTRAYHLAHTADRQGAFRINDAFDEMRDRMMHMRDHPDLAQLEPEVLELAAKMSHVSRDLAEAFSDDRVERARSFIKERQFEVDRFNERLAHATAIQSEFSLWINRIELDEAVARTQMERLLDELETMLPELNTPSPKRVTSAKITKLPTRLEQGAE
ncbi:DNA repair protein [uncultured Tateyamaria sp.]|uniref:DNA repair protein n=1 Tax=uncultured Tateyamaria sp. TaxID=455651 RepID=UPI0026080F80|nr:DNA repair protein [uncultured Tateyamaria sp.]